MLKRFVTIGAVLLAMMSFGANAQQDFWTHTNGPGNGLDVRALASDSHGTLYAGTWTNCEVWKTTDNGDFWVRCSPSPLVQDGVILGLSITGQDHIFASVFGKGMYRSTDGGVTWIQKNTGLTNFTVRGSVVDDSGYVYVTTEGGLFRSLDDGETWTKQLSNPCSSVMFDSAHAVVTTDGYTLSRSEDHGTSWSQKAITNGAGGLGAVLPDGSYINYSIPTAVLRSTDFGTTWTDLHLPVSWDGYNATVAVAKDGTIFFARDGDNSGVAMSSDLGQSWSIVTSGLTTTRVLPVFCHPNGFVFLGTNGSGVFRSTSTTGEKSIVVSLPSAVVATGSAIELPLEIGYITGQRILSFQFKVTFNTPDTVVVPGCSVITSGTMSGANGWSVMANASEPNSVVVGGYGTSPLSGQGALLKLHFVALPSVHANDSTLVQISDFIFNAGTPKAVSTNGKISIRDRVCGDADENGIVQVYDASLALREAIGPFPAPPGPLSPQGRLNVDIDGDGTVSAFDAALILRHVLGLPSSQRSNSCFSSNGDVAPSDSSAFSPQVHLIGVSHLSGITTAELEFGRVEATDNVWAMSFDLKVDSVEGNTARVIMPPLPSAYLGVVHQCGPEEFRIGIINPGGINGDSIRISVSSSIEQALNSIVLSNLLINNTPARDTEMNVLLTEVRQRDNASAQAFDLVGCYPNPFNPTTTVVLSLPLRSDVSLDIFNSLGMRVRSVFSGYLSAGRHEVRWDGRNEWGQTVASGTYMCRMVSGSFMKTIRLVTLK